MKCEKPNPPPAVIVPFPGATTEAGQSNADPDVVALLESYLARAREGEIQDVVLLTTSVKHTHECMIQVTLENAAALTECLSIASQHLAHLTRPNA